MSDRLLKACHDTPFALKVIGKEESGTSIEDELTSTLDMKGETMLFLNLTSWGRWSDDG